MVPGSLGRLAMGLCGWDAMGFFSHRLAYDGFGGEVAGIQRQHDEKN